MTHSTCEKDGHYLVNSDQRYSGEHPKRANESASMNIGRTASRAQASGRPYYGRLIVLRQKLSHTCNISPRICTLLVLLCLLIGGCGNPFSSPPKATSTSTAIVTPHWGVRTKISGCTVRGPLQDPACTPGDIFPDVTREQVCTPGYATSVRNVPTSTKNRVYAEYGITRRLPGQYEVDHLVNLSIGGSNSIANLWPEAVKPKPGSREKDRVENYLHDQVCAGTISLQQAQIEIATDWLSVYNNMPNVDKTPATNGSGSP